MPRIEPTWTSDETAREIGRRLAQHRVLQGLTLDAIAERAGLARSTVQRAEAGDNPTLKTVIRLMRAMDLTGGLELLLPEALVSPLQLARGAQARARPENRDGAE